MEPSNNTENNNQSAEQYKNPTVNPNQNSDQSQSQQFNQPPAPQNSHSQQQWTPGPVDPRLHPLGAQPNNPAQTTNENPSKNYLISLLLSYFLGSIGADRFYLDKIGTGILKLVTLGGLGIWHLVDLLLIAFNKMHAKGDDRPLQGYAENRHWVKILAIVMLVFNVVTIGGLLVLMVVLGAGGTQRNAHDTARKNDLNIATTSIYEYATANNGKYPTTADVQNGKFKIEGNFSELKQSDIIYTALPSNCDNVSVNCRSFTLKTQLANGTTYTVNP